MKYLTNARSKLPCFTRRALILLALLVTPFTGAYAQGVTVLIGFLLLAVLGLA